VPFGASVGIVSFFTTLEEQEGKERQKYKFSNVTFN
jgi:hypothetical protein